MSRKVFFLILIFLALLAALGFTIWSLLRVEEKRPALPDEISLATKSNITAAISAQTERLTPFRKIVSRQVISPVISQTSGKLRFFEGSSGRLFEIPLSGGKENLVAETEISGLSSAIWSPDGSGVITKSRSGIFYYNYSTGLAFPLEAENPVFSPDNNQIAFSCAEGICVSSANGENKKIVLDEPGLKAINLLWDEVIYFYSKASSFSASPVYSLDPKTGRLKRVLPALSGLIFKVKNNNQLYSSGDRLYLNGALLALRALASKCEFSDSLKAIFCAAPQNLYDDESVVLPDDYFKNKFLGKDAIYKIDLERYAREDYQPELITKTNIDVESLLPMEDRLFLKDKETGSLFIFQK